MNYKQDVRWKQRFNNFIKAFKELEEAVVVSKARNLTKLECQGVIQWFEYTHELAWNVLKDYLQEMGLVGLIASKDSTREAFKRGLIDDGEVWMDMILSRNLTSHTYDQELAEVILEKIINYYYPQLHIFLNKFSQILAI